MKPRILLIDDEYFPAEYYERRLKRKFEVLHVVDAAEGIEKLAEGKGQIVAVVLDMMMPVPKKMRGADSGGLRTGVVLLERIRELEPNIPVAVVTNVNGAAELAELRPFSRLSITEKKDTPPSRLTRILLSLIKGENAAQAT